MPRRGATAASGGSGPRLTSRAVHITTAHPGSDGRIASRECSTLRDAGVEVTLVARPPLSALAVESGVVLCPLPTSHSRMSRIAIAPWGAARKAWRFRPDLVHLHDPELIPVGLVLRLLGCRTIYDAHEDLPAQVRDKHWIPKRLRGSVAGGARVLELLAGWGMTAVVAATPSIAKKYPEGRVTVVGNMPRLEDFPLEAIGDRVPRAIYVGGLDEARGAFQLVAAAERLPPGSLVLVGTIDPPELLEELKKRPGWANIDYRGQCSHSESSALQRRSLIGLVTFLPRENHVEALPTKLFEYMASGLAVVASDFPIWRRIVCDAECGILVDPEDPASIASAVLTLIADGQKAAKMGTHGRQAVEGGLNWRTEGERLVRLYRRLLQAGSSTGISVSHEDSGSNADR